MKNSKFLNLFAIAFLLQITAAIASGPSQSEEPPNIVVIMADDQGFSDLGSYGSEIETPNLDKLAQNGLRFTQFYNTGRCWPTRSSLLSGYYTQQQADDWGYLVPQHLDQAGYKSYHSGKWHVPNVEDPMAGGFDLSYWTNDHDRHFAPDSHNLNGEALPPVEENEDYYSATAIATHAVEFLQQHQEKSPDAPFFLYTAFITPHFPLHAPQDLIDKYRHAYLDGWEQLKRQRYKRQKELGLDLGENSPFEYHVTAPWSWPARFLADSIAGEMRYARPWHQLNETQKHLHATKMAIHAAMVDQIDQEVGRIVAQLKAMDAYENTLILFLSDNGASAEQIIRGDGHHKEAPLGSGGSYLCLGPGFSTASNTPFRRHKYWVHEGGIATPLIAHWPEGIEARGELRHSMGHVIDFLPTFLDVAGIDPRELDGGKNAPDLPGKSLVPVFKNDTQVHEALYFSHQGNKALRQGKWKAVISSDIDARWQLYNMEEDRTEMNNLADDFYSFGHPEWKEKYQKRLERMKTRWEELDNKYKGQAEALSSD